MGAHILETLNISTMAELAEIPLGDLRKTFNEATGYVSALFLSIKMLDFRIRIRSLILQYLVAQRVTWQRR